MSITKGTANEEAAAPTWLAVVEDQVRELRFGIVQIVVHEGRVVQVERTERVRLSAAELNNTPPPNPVRPDHRRIS